MLNDLPQVSDPNLLVGMATGDDAAVYRVSEDVAIVQTVDFFPPMVDDPYTFGAISAANSLSDVYATGARPVTAMNIVAFPSDQPKEILYAILRGGADKAAEAGVPIVGGHTIVDPEPKYGMSVTGVVQPGKQLTNAAAKPGDVLILTKPIGTGTITSAAMDGIVDEAVYMAALGHMQALNKAASEAAVAVGVSACTDVTGFGLLGHLRGMARGSSVGARIFYSQVPFMNGAINLAIGQGKITGGTNRNRDYIDPGVKWDAGVEADAWKILYDPQTSGGLLLSVPRNKADRLVKALEERGVECRAVIGEIVSEHPGVIDVLP